MLRAIYGASMLGALSVACWGLDQVHAGVHALERLAAREPSAKAKRRRKLARDDKPPKVGEPVVSPKPLRGSLRERAADLGF